MTPIKTPKKLIEVALPLDAISPYQKETPPYAKHRRRRAGDAISGGVNGVNYYTNSRVFQDVGGFLRCKGIV